MKISILKIILSGLVVCNTCIAQMDADVAGLVEDYKQVMVKRDWYASLDFIYPPIIKVVPKEVFYKQFAELLDDTSEYVLSYKDMIVEEVLEAYFEDSISYCFVNYTLIMTYRSKTNSVEDIESFWSLAKLIYGEEALRLDGNVITITAPKRISAIKDLRDGRMYMLEISKDSKRLISKVMSEAFLQMAYPPYSDR